MYKSLKEVDLKGISTNACDCLAQQLMSLCVFYKNEYWKLFIESPLKNISSNNEVNIDELIDTSAVNNLIEIMSKYYSIDLVREEYKPDNGLQFNSNEVYLAFFDTKFYPLTEGVEVDDESKYHAFLIYEIKNDKYIVHDNFYGLQEYQLEKEIFDKGIKKLYKVFLGETLDYDSKEEDNLVNNRCKERDYYILKKWFEECQKNSSFTYDDHKLFVKLRYIFSKIETLSFVVGNKSKQNIYLTEIVDLLHSNYEKLRSIWYSLMKNQIRYKCIEREYFVKRITEVELLYKKIDNIQAEIIKILNNEESTLKTKLNIHLQEYCGRKIEEDRNIYEDHDGISILNIFKFFEEKYEIELDSIFYSGMNTYEEFLRRTYRIILNR